MKKVVVMGGSFNPPTIAHQKMLLYIVEQLGADKGVFVPSPYNYVYAKMERAGMPEETLPDEVRLKMLSAMCEDDERLEVDDIECKNPENWYTTETMNYMQEKYPDAHITCLGGADRVRGYINAYRFIPFTDKYSYTVVTRGEDDPIAILKEKPQAWERRERFNIIPAPVGLEGISSSAIRNKLRSGETGAEEMCHPKVWELLIQYKKESKDIMLKNFKGAIFDMDGTLIDSLMFWDVLWKKFSVKYLNGEKFEPTTEENKAIRTMILKDAIEYLYSIYKLGESAEELLETTNQMIVDFYSNEVLLKQGVLEFLEYCRKNGIKMCIASATDIDFIKIAAKHCKIEKYFEDILSCAQIGKGKDKPDIYIKALERIGTDKDDTYVFEDSLVAIKTANAIGLKTVGIYDINNFGHEEMKKVSTVYIDKDETLEKLLP